ncbi:MAG: hypothetical protein HY914_18690 [Desulfomonile tiedjei]|nr:hypothetical protein [Desulfomonile tiedjei]
MILVKLLCFVLLGLLSAALSYYGKNYYVRIFDDIIGREEDPKVESRIGRGFYYGFFFPVYFSLLLSGLVALVAFLIVAGVIAAIVFVIGWVIEKILPHEWAGNIVRSLFDSVGIKGPRSAAPPAPATETASPLPGPTGAAPSSSPSSTPEEGGTTGSTESH